MHITESVIKADRIIYEKSPKTSTGIRSIPLGKETVEILKKSRAIMRNAKLKIQIGLIQVMYYIKKIAD